MAIFCGAILVLAVVWFFGIAMRASLREDVDVVARAGISRVVGTGFGQLVNAVLLLGLAIAAYFTALWALHKGFRYGFAAAIAGTTITSLAILPSMPLTSPDAVHLAADVRTFWIHGKWPAEFDGAPAQIDDPVANEVRVFRGQPSGYGPVAYALGGLALPFVGDDFKANLLGQKVIAGLFLALTAAAAGYVAGRMGQNRGFVAGIIGLNPLLTWHFPGDGHNDVLMAFFAVVAVGMVMQQSWKWRAGGVFAWLLGTLCKYGIVLASPVVAAYWWPRWRNQLAAITAIVGGAVVFIYSAEGGVRNGTLGPASAIVSTTPWSIIDRVFDPSQGTIVATGFVLFLLLLAVVMMYHRLETQEDMVAAVALVLGLFLFVCSPGYLAWYQVWFLPIAAMSNSRWLITAAIAFSLTAFLPILALNWGPAMIDTLSLSRPIDVMVVIAWLGTIAAAYVGARGKNWAKFGGTGEKATGPRFAPRAKRRATGV